MKSCNPTAIIRANRVSATPLLIVSYVKRRYRAFYFVWRAGNITERLLHWIIRRPIIVNSAKNVKCLIHFAYFIASSSSWKYVFECDLADFPRWQLICSISSLYSCESMKSAKLLQIGHWEQLVFEEFSEELFISELANFSLNMFHGRNSNVYSSVCTYWARTLIRGFFTYSNITRMSPSLY